MDTANLRSASQTVQQTVPKRLYSAPIFVILILLLCLGCQTSSIQKDIDCPDEQVAEWEIPAGSLVREISVEDAYLEVLTGNIPTSGIRDRWESLRNRAMAEDRFWHYYREEDELTIHSVGSEEGIVLIHGCDQIGFVATSVWSSGEPNDYATEKE